MENADSKPFFCTKPWTGFEIENDGTVRQCCMTKIKSCGNINEYTIKEIWNGERYQEARKMMAEGNWRDVCREDCPRVHGALYDATTIPLTERFDENYKKSQEEIEKRALVLESYPRFWKITHSTRCNIDCVMCYQDRNDHRSLPDKFYDDIKENISHVQEIILLGGETFAIKHLRNMLDDFPRATYPDVAFAIVTNGTIHDDKILEIVKRSRINWLSISVDAVHAETYAKIRRGGNFSVTKTGIQKWAALGKEMSFPVTVTFTIMRDNVAEAPEFIDFARQFKVDCLYGIVQGDKGGQNQLDKAVLKSALTAASGIASQYQEEMPFANLTLKSLFSLVD